MGNTEEHEGRDKHTLTTKQNRQVPQLSHIERLKHLSLITSTITIQRHSRILIPIILMRKRKTSTNRNLSTDYTVSTIESLCKHMHGSTLSIRDSVTTTKQLANDGCNGSTTHESKSVAAVCGDDVVFFGEGVFDSDGDCFLAGGEMAEPSNFLLFVESVCGHFHTAGSELAIVLRPRGRRKKLLREGQRNLPLNAAEIIAYRTETISAYILFNSFFVVSIV